MTNDLFGHLDGLLAAAGELPARQQQFNELQSSVSAVDVSNIEPEELQRWAGEMRSVFDQAYGDIFSRIGAHHDAVLQLASDPALINAVRRVSRYAEGVKSAVEDLIVDIEYARTANDLTMLVIKMIGVAITFAPSQPQVVQALAFIVEFRRREIG